MRISDIINLGMEYLVRGIFAAVLVGICFALWYFMYFKKKRPGEKLKIWKVLLWGIFLVYLVVVLGATMLSRGNYYGNTRIYPFFYSYKDAWNDFSITKWQQIILNIMMFIPFGFLLPILSKKMAAFWKVYMAGFGLTAIIEIAQLVLSIGIFESDDLMGNALGVIIGYGIFRLGKYIVLWKKREKRKNFGKVVLLQIPLLLVVIAFTTIFVVYYTKELGNLSNGYVVKQKNISVTSGLNFDTRTSNEVVYKVPVLTVEETEKIAKELFARQNCGIDESRTDVYENSVIYYSDDGGRHIWFEYDGGVFTFMNFEKGFYVEDSVVVKSDATEEEIRTALEDMGIFIPDMATFENKGEGIYRFEVALAAEQSTVYDGYAECVYYEDGECGEIDYQILKLEKYKEFAILSQQHAYEKLTDGQFTYYSQKDDMVKIHVRDIKLGYALDTKGFYQPAYFFNVVVNEQETEIMIPAIQ